MAQPERSESNEEKLSKPDARISAWRYGSMTHAEGEA